MCFVLCLLELLWSLMLGDEFSLAFQACQMLNIQMCQLKSLARENVCPGLADNLPVQVLCDQWDQRVTRVFVGCLHSPGRQVCQLHCWHLH